MNQVLNPKDKVYDARFVDIKGFQRFYWQLMLKIMANGPQTQQIYDIIFKWLV